MNEHFSRGKSLAGNKQARSRRQHDVRWPDEDLLHVDIEKKKSHIVGWIVAIFLLAVPLVFVLGYFFMGATDGGDKIDFARIQARAVSQAVMAYHADHGDQFPPTLLALLEADPATNKPYIENADRLLDPWGRTYQYDPTEAQQLANGGIAIVPEVFTFNPADGRKINNRRER